MPRRNKEKNYKSFVSHTNHILLDFYLLWKCTKFDWVTKNIYGCYFCVLYLIWDFTKSWDLCTFFKVVTRMIMSLARTFNQRITWVTTYGLDVLLAFRVHFRLFSLFFLRKTFITIVTKISVITITALWQTKQGKKGRKNHKEQNITPYPFFKRQTNFETEKKRRNGVCTCTQLLHCLNDL